MSRKSVVRESHDPEPPLSFFACSNPECADFNRFDVGNLSVAERMGKDRAIRRLYCHTCHHRFSEREGSLLADTKLAQEVVVRIVKCLGHGCSVEATADICEVDPRTVQRILAKAGRRAEDFHRLQLERLNSPPDTVEVDEVHAHAADDASQKKGRPGNGPRVIRGFIRRWRSRAGLFLTFVWVPGRWRPRLS